MNCRYSFRAAQFGGVERFDSLDRPNTLFLCQLLFAVGKPHRLRDAKLTGGVAVRFTTEADLRSFLALLSNVGGVL
jgi:hypothetical protein